MNPETLTPSRAIARSLSTARGRIAAVFLLGTLAYTMVALLSDPLLPPGDAVIHLQAHDTGTYYQKLTFLSTWLFTVGVAMALGAATWVTVRVLGAGWSLARGAGLPKAPVLPEGPQWQQVLHRPRLRFALLAVGMVALGLPPLVLLMVDPETLYPLGFFGPVLVLFATIAFPVGQAFLLDSVFLPCVHIGRVEKREVQLGQRGARNTHAILSGGHRWFVPEAQWATLTEGTPIAVRFARATRLVLDLRVENPAYR